MKLPGWSWDRSRTNFSPVSLRATGLFVSGSGPIHILMQIKPDPARDVL
jgi:hypothetical protein